ncbi:UDP-N-acetylglucosamine--N-acetylmuramyl-(pentapeptide) pyrophosphoryl-undecaprenol N-acetylglucosamine transferase [Anaerohalosphaera lusitana]|uniref:UDP-N-acetylglucosamine--N-acetylmuramyl-(pentapeptide) pyrophosphoryl-undecaprenol N-acetylglucosamine transferase n=1 Tax=Anaerohalosphaera lusitana TaxID=1936003 RepID=A0A1U9NIV4_9BACT|nr:UDP-N-acetylglucosamine--N-acetylmuramyl-(pentapeptide) pyrophosphoryl-undecaprenol N-acetylglucosamine transferase [Anaerohalosphaera lusitana]AQT67654.1 UDP-N-acetylglucosamine--N-acetylmuramyl-(pentapeptide) pyrophosphoryl-undecaprenol N-acetylglucosamine transferase [Anaerohalosphaera lusitana]
MLKTGFCVMAEGDVRHYFFAGGGTGGHIYPALAVAQQLAKIDPDAKIHFFCSTRDIDAQILSKSGFSYTPVEARGLSSRPVDMAKFVVSLVKGRKFATCQLRSVRENSVVIGVGGFASAPVVLAAKGLSIPVVMLNTDLVPGKANRFLARYAQRIFVQFEDSAKYFKTNATIEVTGCPLREELLEACGAHRRQNSSHTSQGSNAGADAKDQQGGDTSRGHGPPYINDYKKRAYEKFGLDAGKKTLLITGASSGCVNINKAMSRILYRLGKFADEWQIVHLAGRANYDEVRGYYENEPLECKVLDYCDEMGELYAAADLLVGRAGAVSVAEYAACGVPAVCLPYPYHKDKHQYLNAQKLVDAGAAVIVDDRPDDNIKTADELFIQLEKLMSDYKLREQMGEDSIKIARPDASLKIADCVADILKTLCKK